MWDPSGPEAAGATLELTRRAEAPTPLASMKSSWLGCQEGIRASRSLFRVLTAACPRGGDVGGNGPVRPVLFPHLQHPEAALELVMGFIFFSPLAQKKKKKK